MKNFFKLVSIIVFLSSCGGGGGGGGGGGDAGGGGSFPAPTISITSDISSASTGDSALISWTSTNATSCTASGGWTGGKGTSGSESISLVAGNNTFSLSCSGSGGSFNQSVVVFAFDFGLETGTITINEDTVYSGSIAASPNETLTNPLQYSITSNPEKGILDFRSEDAGIVYTPNSNINGADSFTYEVFSSDKGITKQVTINIEIISVNDIPKISFEVDPGLSKNSMVIDQSYDFRVNVEDVDSQMDSLQFSALIDDSDFAASFVLDEGDNPNGTGTLTLDLGSLALGGLFNVDLIVSDGENSAKIEFESWFVGYRETVTINQDVDPEDGFNGGEKILKDYNVYYLVGQPGDMGSLGRTNYLFIGDSLNGEADIDLYRRALLASLNKVRESDAGAFFKEDYFKVVSVEPVEPDGTSPTGIRTGCYSFDETVYCVGDMDTAIFDDFLPDNTLVSTLTRVQGRGVNLGNRNIQRIRDTNPERTSTTLMHELGHAHGYMGDEYRSDDDRDVSAYADLNINTSTQGNATVVKWNHHFEDSLNILGRDVQVCYNYADGTIADFDNVGVVIEDCGCFANNWDDQGNFVGKNEECNKVGHFEGNYYGLYDNYRPNFCNIMDSCSSGGYGKVNTEGFAVGSLQNQGFYDPGSASTSSNEQGQVTSWNISIDVKYNPEQITLKWYVDGVEDVSKENQTSVSFGRPSDNGVRIYTYKGIDLTGTIIASDDPMNNNDFYRGIMQSSFIWVDSNGNTQRDPVDGLIPEYDYGYMFGPVGGSWGVNWAKW